MELKELIAVFGWAGRHWIGMCKSGVRSCKHLWEAQLFNCAADSSRTCVEETTV